MPRLSFHDVSWARRKMPKPLFELCKQHGRRIVIAGGFLRSCVTGERVNDIDVFSRSVDDAKLFAGQLAGTNRGRLIETDNAITVTGHRVPVQFIHRWTFDNPADVCKSFDFTIASAALWWDEEKNFWESRCGDRFYVDLAAKRLVYTSPKRNEDAGGSLLRVLKFYQLGYRIPLDSLGAVMARLMQSVDFGKPEIREVHGAAREAQVAKVLSGLLREVDPNIDPETQDRFYEEAPIDGEFAPGSEEANA